MEEKRLYKIPPSVRQRLRALQEREPELAADGAPRCRLCFRPLAVSSDLAVARKWATGSADDPSVCRCCEHNRAGRSDDHIFKLVALEQGGTLRTTARDALAAGCSDHAALICRLADLCWAHAFVFEFLCRHPAAIRAAAQAFLKTAQWVIAQESTAAGTAAA